MLILPSYIERTKICDAPILHTWDDSDPMLAYATLNQRLGNKIGEISWRGQVALSLGYAEWVAWRLRKFCDDDMLLKKAEAVWAGIIDLRYLSKQAIPPGREWQGPVRAPLWAAHQLLNQIIDLLRRAQFFWPEATCLSKLVVYVLPKSYAFKKWERVTIQQLSGWYPRPKEVSFPLTDEDVKSLLGPPVPREALEPGFEPSPEKTRMQLRCFLQGLDPSKNPYLSSPDEMLKNGFPGKPYSI